jgi:hypothetical protein
MACCSELEVAALVLNYLQHDAARGDCGAGAGASRAAEAFRSEAAAVLAPVLAVRLARAEPPTNADAD